MNTGQFAPAEDLLGKLLGDRGPEGEQARQALLLLYHIQSRPADLRELTLASWVGASDPAMVLKKLYLLDHSAFPIDRVTRSLESADPNDDRVWLGKANLATWTGRFDEAARLLRAAARAGRTMRPSGGRGSNWRARLATPRLCEWPLVISRRRSSQRESCSISGPGWRRELETARSSKRRSSAGRSRARQD